MVDGSHGVGRGLDVWSVYDRLGLDFIGLQEARGSGHSAFTQAGFLVYCSGERSSENDGKKRQGGVVLLARKSSIMRAPRPPEFTSDRLLKVTLELFIRGRAKAVTFIVAYAPTETQNASKKHAFWTTLDRAVKEVSKHELLFLLMDANARSGRREKGGVGSRDKNILGTSGRDTLNDNAELLLSFANNHDLAFVNTRSLAHPRAAYDILSTGKAKNVSATFQRDNIIANSYGTLRCIPQPFSLPISDRNIVSPRVELIDQFVRNRRLRISAKPPVDRRRLMTDTQFWQKVTTATGRNLMANPPRDSSMDDVEAAFTVTILRTAELVILHQERRRPRRSWSGDAQTEAELQASADVIHTAWQRIKIDTRNAQPRTVVRYACNWLKRVRSAPVLCFFERHVVELGKQSRRGDRHRFFQNIKSMQLEEIKRSNRSTSVAWERDCCETKDVSARDGCDSSARC